MARSSCMAADMLSPLGDGVRFGRFPSGTRRASQGADRRKRKQDGMMRKTTGTTLKTRGRSTFWSPARAMSGWRPQFRWQARPSLAVAIVDAAPAGAWERTTAPRRSRRRPAACSTARLLGRDRAAGPGDHRHDRHRFAHLRPGAAGVPDLRRRGRRRASRLPTWSPTRC